MALSYYEKGNKEKAVKILTEMVEGNPNNRWSKLARKKLSDDE
jgi:TolA-binding protein